MFDVKDLRVNSFRWKLSKLIPNIRVLMQRGMGYIYEVRNGLAVGAGLKLLFNVSLFETIIILIFAFLGFFVLGFIDLKWLHWMQSEQKLNTSTYNPHLNKITDIVNKIKKREVKNVK